MHISQSCKATNVAHIGQAELYFVRGLLVALKYADIRLRVGNCELSPAQKTGLKKHGLSSFYSVSLETLQTEATQTINKETNPK